MSMQKGRRRLQAEVSAVADVLRREWDPIGRGEMPDLPADEYASYAPHVVSLIGSGADDRTVATHLKTLEDETIGASSGKDLIAVAALVRHAVAKISQE